MQLTSILLFTYVIAFSSTLIGLFLLYQLRRLSVQHLMRSLLFISSSKSKTAAILLGGLIISLSVIGSLAYYCNMTSLVQNLIQLKILHYGFISSILLIGHGYLDDRFELRPIIKLLFQAISVLIFTLNTTHHLATNNDVNLIFVLYFIIGMALINGNNLLDGLDTLALKTNIPSFFAFALLGQLLHAPLISALSLSIIGALSAFYWFNRAPAKIYLGEIGSVFLGFSYLVLITLLQQHQQQYQNPFSLFFMALIPVMLPIAELLISFLRRLLAKKAPFKGDKLHLHYILVNYYQLTSNQTTLFYFSYTLLAIFIALGSTLYLNISSLVIISLQLLSYLVLNYTLCYRYWTVNFNINSPLSSLFHKMKKQHITLIDINSIDQFELTVIMDRQELTNKQQVA